MAAYNKLLLSLFPGIDMLGSGFEQHNFCVVRGPDKITGGDIRKFKPPENTFFGVIGGPPCQDFSLLNRNPGRYSYKMLNEYCRVIKEAKPEWFLFENVATAPDFQIDGYQQQRFSLDLAWFSDFSRLRTFIFGSRSGKLLNPIYREKNSIIGTAVVGNDQRSFKACCEIQGLDSDFDLPFFTLTAKKQAIANGVPLQMSDYLARLILRDFYNERPEGKKEKAEHRHCKCGCGRVVVGRALYFNAACRKRMQRWRQRKSQVHQPACHG